MAQQSWCSAFKDHGLPFLRTLHYQQSLCSLGGHEPSPLLLAWLEAFPAFPLPAEVAAVVKRFYLHVTLSRHIDT